MKKPTYLEWANSQIRPVALEALVLEELALEKEATFDEVYKKSGWMKKIGMKLVSLFGYVPDLAFQKEDVDMHVVQQILQHKELLQAVSDWISDTNYELLPKLHEAKKVFEAIQRPKPHPILYRGFKINPGQQNSGIAERYKQMKPGDKWQHTPDKPMSFSWHQGTTRAYGDIIVSANYNALAKRCLHITNEMVAALFHLDLDGNIDPNYEMKAEAYIFTYAESVFLPDGKPIEFTLVSKG
jgi:hypothetical protein